MKKIMALCLGALLILLSILILPIQKAPSYTVLLDRYEGAFSAPLNLIYANLTGDTLSSYTLKRSKLSKTSEPLTAYYEGTLPTKEHADLLTLINAYRETQGQPPLITFYNTFTTTDYTFVATSEGLDALYIIDKQTQVVQTPHFATEALSATAQAKQYPYYLIESSEGYYLLTGKANSLETYLYLLEHDTLTFTQINALTAHPSAISRKDLLLTTHGIALLRQDNGLDILTLTQQDHLSVTHPVEWLLEAEETIYLLGTTDGQLFCSSLASDLTLLETTTFSLPNASAVLVDTLLMDGYLYTLTYDRAHPTYPYYLTTYNLSTSQMDFILGLKPMEDLVPLWLDDLTP